MVHSSKIFSLSFKRKICFLCIKLNTCSFLKTDHKEIQINRSRNISEVIKSDKHKLIKLLNDVKKCKQESVSYFIDILIVCLFSQFHKLFLLSLLLF